MPTPEEVPVGRALRWIAATSLLASVVVLLLGAWRIGVTWDEPLHVQRYDNYAATGWYLGDGQVEGGEPTEGMKQQFVYGPATMLLLHGLGRVAGTDEPGSAGVSDEAYVVRHLGVAALSLLGVLAVVCTGRLLLRRWDWALVAGATLAAIPLWTGHAMFNLKDVPVGTGYALATLGLTLITRAGPPPHRAVALAGPLSLAAGTWLAVGTRPGMWTGVAASCGALVVCWLLGAGDGSLRARVTADRRRYRDLAVGLALAAAALWAIYPNVFSSPLHAMLRAALGSANFLDASAPWSFVPVRVMLQVPLLILGFVAVGSVVAVRRIVRGKFRPDVQQTRLVLLLVQMLTLPVIAIVHGASLYGDLRQLLFSVPATALLAAFGMQAATRRARRSTQTRLVPVIAALTGAALVVPVVDQALLFPYGYTYYNPLATAAQVHGDGDYYRASGRELAEEVPRTGRIVCTPQTDEAGRAMRVAHLDGWVDCADALSSPISAYAGKRHADGPKLGSEEFWAISFNAFNRSADNCARERAVERRTWWGTLRLASLLRCSRPFPVVDSGTIPFTARPQSGVDLPDLGWYSFGTDGTTEGIRSRGGASTLRFRLGDEFDGRDVDLAFEVTRRDDVTVTFAGRELPVTWQSAGKGGGERPVLRVTVPAEVVRQAIATEQILEFAPVAAPPLSLKIWAMNARAAD